MIKGKVSEYWVGTGKLEDKIEASSPYSAAIKFFKRVKRSKKTESFGAITVVRLRKRKDNPDDVLFLTEKLLDDAGIDYTLRKEYMEMMFPGAFKR